MGLSDLAADLFVYDVGHGDHLLLRVRDGERTFHAAIDCNWPNANAPPPALAQLQAWGVTTLDLLVLTHPHQDHFTGLARIAGYFTAEGRSLRRFADFGLDLRLVADRRFTRGQAAHAELYRLHAAVFEGDPATRPRHSPVPGPFPARSVTDHVTLEALAPVPDRLREQHERLLAGGTVSPNRLSSVLLWRAATWTILLAGDLEADDWDEALRRAAEANIDLRADAVKVGHHGAPNGNPPALWERVVRADRPTHAPCPRAARGCTPTRRVSG
ncbi:MAG: hypothetical protein KIT58_03755 [Planctomycetota bacterium]|nr:hypothetical protein [Planctomycetota bacterium]